MKKTLQEYSVILNFRITGALYEKDDNVWLNQKLLT